MYCESIAEHQRLPMPCNQHQVPSGNNAKSFRIIDDWYLREAILLALIHNITGQEFVPGWRGDGEWFEPF